MWLQFYEDILSNQIFNLPEIRRNNEKDYFPSFISQKFQTVLNYLQKEGSFLKFKLDFFRIFTPIFNKIEKIIDFYYKGLIFKSFKEFRELLNPFLDGDFKYSYLLGQEIFNFHQDSSPPNAPNPFDVFNRARISQDSFNRVREPKDCFHAPFNMQYNLPNYRYSIQGHPSLYLGNSSYICWREMNQPDLNHFNVVRYRTKKELFRFLDLSWRPITVSMFLSWINKLDDQRKKEKILKFCRSYFKMWPILFMCSIAVPNDCNDDQFHPEYIFPQFLMQHISEQLNTKEEEFDGICYFSVHCNQDYSAEYGFSEYHTDLLSKNYVIPIVEAKQTGFSDILFSKFNISYPNSLQKMELGLSQPIRDNFYKNHYILDIPGIMKANYDITTFGNLERNVIPSNYTFSHRNITIDFESMQIITNNSVWVNMLNELEVTVNNRNITNQDAIITNKSDEELENWLNSQFNISISEISTKFLTEEKALRELLGYSFFIDYPYPELYL